MAAEEAMNARARRLEKRLRRKREKRVRRDLATVTGLVQAALVADVAVRDMPRCGNSLSLSHG